MTTVRTSLNKANPASIAMDLQRLAFGEVVNLIPKLVRAAVVGHKLVLPEGAKAARLLSAFGVGGSNGYKLPLAVGSSTAPSAGEVTVNGAGDIVFATADAITLATVVYVAQEGEIFEDTIDVVSNVGALLGNRSAAVLLSAQALIGTVVGAEAPVQRGATPSTGQAAIQGASDKNIVFAGADAVTRATVRYLAVPGEGVTTNSTVAAALLADLPIV